MRQLQIFFVLAFLCPHLVWADELTVVADSTLGGDILLAPGSTSEILTVRVINDRQGDDPEDFMSGWQLSLAIVANAGATGSVEFLNPDRAASEYVFEGSAGFGSFINGGNDLTAFDTPFPLSGFEIPLAPGAALLDTSFTASPDAMGSFQLVVLADEGLSEWTDSMEPNRLRRQFTNVPVSAVPTVLATISIGLPGDYNDDGSVDLADYTVWRNNLGAPPGTLFNDPVGGAIDMDHYIAWKNNFGASLQPIRLASSHVPEPSSWWLITLLSLSLLATRISEQASTG